MLLSFALELSFAEKPHLVVLKVNDANQLGWAVRRKPPIKQ